MSILSQVIDDDQMQKITAEFSRLGDRCYLENAGASLYPQCLIAAVNKDLENNFYMNPHSDKYTRDCIEQIRCTILNHFNTDSTHYTVIFTSGCTESLKLVAESFKFSCNYDNYADTGSFVYLQDNHTSVIGLREIVKDRASEIISIPHEDFLRAINDKYELGKEKMDNNSLLAYPAQSNFNGYKYPIDCLDKIRGGCLNNFIMKHLGKINCNWYILLDAATYVASNKLDLSKYQPDFVSLSFYKIFGFPTGLGALLVKNSSEHVLGDKMYFGGGTVDVVLSSEPFHVKRSNLSERFEDGTVSFLSIIALKHCFECLDKLIPKVVSNNIMDTVSLHTFFLAKDLNDQLKELKHPNGRKASILYMDSDFSTITLQGGCVTFNLLRQDGSYIGYAEFQHMADLFNVNVRTGCFCNSGSCQRHLGVSNKDMKDLYKAGHKCGDDIDLVNGRPTGAIRASFGYFNTFKDVDKFMQMICHCFVKTELQKLKRERITAKNIHTIVSQQNNMKNGHAKKIYCDHKYLNKQIPDRNCNDEVKLREIVIFPIKSCGAFKVHSSWKIGSKGFEYDREWMIVKDNGVCLTQKQNTRMCMIKPVVDLDNRVLVLNFKGKQPITVPLDLPSHTELKETTICQSKICTDMVKGYDCGDSVADWISEACEVSYLRLIRQSSEDTRSIKKKETGPKLLSLSNQAQYLLINKGTVKWLHDKIDDPQFIDSVDRLTDRFRGNIVVDMESELTELDWQKVIIGQHEFKVEGQCPRCQMVCIDQQTGEKTVEPLRTISELFGGKMRFGIYLSYIGTVGESKDCKISITNKIKPILKDDGFSR